MPEGVLAVERARKRDELLAATEKELDKIAAATRRDSRPLRGRDKIALRVGKVINKFKMAKHFTLEITDEAFTFARNHHDIAAESALDGIYVLRTSLPDNTLPTDDVVTRYKGLEDVERFFRTLNTGLDVRPIRHRLVGRVRAHVFLRMLSYYLSWHMKQDLAPILFCDHDKPAARANRTDPVAAAQRSNPALAKASRKRTEDDYPVHNDFCAAHNRADAIPMVRRQCWRSSTSQFRRTLAWFIARRPGGAIAGTIQYRHHSIQMFEGYAGTSESGFRGEVKAEQTLQRGERLFAMIENHEHHDLRGPAAREAQNRLDNLQRSTAYRGSVITDRRRLVRLMRREDPHTYSATLSPASTTRRRRSADAN